MKPVVSSTVSTLPLLELPAPSTTEVAKKSGLLSDDPLQRSLFEVANGPRKASYGTDTLVAKAMVTSAALSLQGVIRDVEHWAQDRGSASFNKLIRGLEHANKEMQELTASRDVQIERWSLTEVGINVHQGHLFHELSELQARFGELLEAVGRSPLEQFARSDFTERGNEAKRLFTQLSKLLTESQSLESHVLWHARPEGEGPSPIETIFPATALGKSSLEDRRLTDAYRKHLDAENLLASGNYPEAIGALFESATIVARMYHQPTNCGHALIYLADALVLTGLDKQPIEHVTRVGLDAGELYHAAAMFVRSAAVPDDQELRRLVAYVHAQLHDLGRHELATQTTREALSPGYVQEPDYGLLLGLR